MGLIRIYQGKSKPANKKPGWQKAELEHKEWLQRVSSQKLFSSKPKFSAKQVQVLVPEPSMAEARSSKIQSFCTLGGAATKAVPRPELTYRENPEMLARELIARERKYNVAPSYNKGGDMFQTDEAMKDVMSGANRRRN
jgi:hypothetical protein